MKTTDDRITRNRELARALHRLDKSRQGAGQCRHCGGTVPCWSEFGDQAPGKRHSMQSFLRRIQEAG